MAVDLNEVAEKMKKQQNIGVTRDGRLVEKDPRNDGTSRSNANEGSVVKVYTCLTLPSLFSF